MILVVEDNLEDSDLLTRELVRANLDDEVYVIDNGQDAYDYLLQTSPAPDVVFLDLKLPRLSGIQLLEEIRKEPRLYHLPVVVMTSSISPTDAEICARHGVTAFLPKPISLSLFKKVIGATDSSGQFLSRSIDPHFLDLASPMLQT
jgi:CheY-like chemotaxis protein